MTKFLRGAAVVVSAVPLLVMNVPNALASTKTFWLVPIADYNIPQYSWKTSPSSQTHFTLIDESTCNSSDYLYTTIYDLDAHDTFSISGSSIPNGRYITGFEVKACIAEYVDGDSGIGAYLYMNVLKNGTPLDPTRFVGWEMRPFGTSFTEVTYIVPLGTPVLKNALSTFQLGMWAGPVHDYAVSAKVSRVAVRFIYE